MITAAEHFGLRRGGLPHETLVRGGPTDSLKLPPRLWRLAFDHMIAYDDTWQLAGITARTLLLWGDRDALFSRADQDRFIDAVPPRHPYVQSPVAEQRQLARQLPVKGKLAPLALRAG